MAVANIEQPLTGVAVVEQALAPTGMQEVVTVLMYVVEQPVTPLTVLESMG